MSTGRVDSVLSLLNGRSQTSIVLRLRFTELVKKRRHKPYSEGHISLLKPEGRIHSTSSRCIFTAEYFSTLYKPPFLHAPSFLGSTFRGRKEARLEDRLPQRQIEIITLTFRDFHSHFRNLNQKSRNLTQQFHRPRNSIPHRWWSVWNLNHAAGCHGLVAFGFGLNSKLFTS